MSQLIDDEGNVHTQSPFTGGWRQKQGTFGPAKDTNIFGQPNVRRDLLGRPVAARDGLGRVIRDGDEPLYEPASPSSFEPGGGDAEAMFIFFIVIIVAWVVSALFALLGKMVAALIETWRELERRYPRAMLIVRLVISMAAIGYALGAVGFDPRIQLAGIALVPGLWGWLWLTRRVSVIFLPINDSPEKR